MLAQVDAATIYGIDALAVQVEVDAAPGDAKVTIVGLPDAAVKEAGERVRAAMRNSSFKFPSNVRLLVNLAPADMRKEGPGFDLPIALGIIMATGQIDQGDIDHFVVIGELSLDGSVRSVPGVLPIALAARAAGKTAIIVPKENAGEAEVVDGLQVFPVESLAETTAIFTHPAERNPLPGGISHWTPEDVAFEVDLHEVKGQEHVRRALEVAAAGGHNMLMV